MFIVGLTGGIATGKSTVSAMFQELGAPVVDADLIARQIIEPGKKAWKKIKETFGEDILLESGEVDRPKLNAVIFSDSENRQKINKITHPEIFKAIKWEVIKYCLKGEPFVILDLPLMFEGWHRWMGWIEKTIVVSCEDEVQLERLMKRNNYTEKEAITRIEAQMPLEEKCEKADIIIENSYSLLDTRKQVEEHMKLLRASKKHIEIRLTYFSYIFAFLAIIAAIIYYTYYYES